MKKFIILTLSLVLLFSIFVMSSCEKAETNAPTSEINSSDEETTSSEEKVSRNFGNSKDESATYSAVIGDNSTNQPTSTSAQEGLIGESFYPKQVNVPENASIELKMLIQMITYLEITPSNFREQESLLLDAELLYSQIPDKSQVINYDDLVKAKETYEKLVSQAEINEFNNKYAEFSAIATPTKADVPLVATLKSMAESLNGDQTSKIADFNTKKANVLSAYDSLKLQGFMQFSFIADNETAQSSSFFIFSNTNPETGSTGQDKFTVDGKYLSNTVRFNFGETITFNTSITGKLKIYCSNNDRTSTCSHDDGTTITENRVMIPDADDNNYREFTLTKAGNYTISINEGEIFIYAIILTA